jgi:hypothetical protein
MRALSLFFLKQLRIRCILYAWVRGCLCACGASQMMRKMKATSKKARRGGSLWLPQNLPSRFYFYF